MLDAGGAKGLIVDSLGAAAALFRGRFENAKAERLYVAHLATDGSLLGFRVGHADLDKQIDFPVRPSSPMR